MDRTASAHWQGGLKRGAGRISTGSSALQNLPYSFGTRFEGQQGTNPEELIGAAHAGCFAMALSGQLEQAGLTAENIDVTATVKLEKTEAGWTITESHLDLVARIPGADPAKFEKAARDAKEGCPVSRLLHTRITLNARLEGSAQTGGAH
ncbi:MAG TPA: OsmC family protein [Bryobacteraceae bacterium]|nr:OsmC family protein [Bryobacteraceae bacterium]